MSVIVADKVSIRYITGDLKNIGLKEYLIRKMQGNYVTNDFWADKDISFSLEKGDMLGIIGTNGAGKSTLLKAISGIMEPTKGKIVVQGNIAALLELSSGFDGELTVRENTYFRGALLGYTRSFMDREYEHIIAFAELEDFQDTPFKHLSSGMKSRLAFSIACLVNPDIIILDEVLSVGDGAFRAKSAAKLKSVLAKGVTGIIVSHSLSQIRELCNKVLWLDKGKQIAFGDKVEVLCDAYEEYLEGKPLPQKSLDIAMLAYARDSKRKLKESELKAIERRKQQIKTAQKQGFEFIKKMAEINNSMSNAVENLQAKVNAHLEAQQEAITAMRVEFLRKRNTNTRR